MVRVLAWLHAGIALAAGVAAALVLVAALFQEEWLALVGLLAMIAAGPLVLLAAARRHRGAYRGAALLHAAAALLFLGPGALGPAAVATLLFLADGAFAVRAGRAPQP